MLPQKPRVTSNILDPRAHADREQALDDTTAAEETAAEEDTETRETETRAPGITFDATKESFDYVENDDTWQQTRLNGLGWCNPAGRHPPAKRAKP